MGVRYQVDISALVGAGELKQVSGFNEIAQDHDLSNVLSLVDADGALGHRCRRAAHTLPLLFLLNPGRRRDRAVAAAPLYAVARRHAPVIWSF